MSSRHVSFNEVSNQTREFDPVSLEDKPNLWLSREQIRRNKVTVQTEIMMERTKALVKEKLLEDIVLDDQDPDMLVKQVEMLQQRLVEIMSGPKEKILAFLKSKYNWIEDSNHYWKDLPENIRQAASVLGYNEDLWNEFNQQLEAFDKPWQQLPEVQREAAKTLGYNEVTWDMAFDAGDGYSDQREATALSWKQPAVVEDDSPASEDDAGENDDEPMYDWNSNESPSDAPSDEMSGSSQSSTTDDSTSDEEADDSTPSPCKGIVSVSKYRENYVQTKVAPATIDAVDEDEFISNFLADSPSGTSSSSLQQNYVASDDEMDLGGDDKALGANELDSKAPLHYDPEMEDVKISEETSPLLGDQTNSYKDGARTGLIRRVHSSDEDNEAISIPFGNATKKGQPLLTKRQWTGLVMPGLIVLALALLAFGLYLRGL
eukprot:Nitzschia sp. Nitz4//scaffold5_size260463//102381//103676//NITZ4_000974-RA/size260463-processed-gene-0.315-mRNA-1//1//CDS//3329555316//2146//frame0